MYQKFIITDDGHLRFGTVYMHRDLLRMGEGCTGGGLWTIDESRQAIVLYGRSFDFGTPDFSEVKVIEWTTLSGRELPLLFAPHYPALDPLEPVFARP